MGTPSRKKITNMWGVPESVIPLVSLLIGKVRVRGLVFTAVYTVAFTVKIAVYRVGVNFKTHLKEHL